jgi:Rrf2 family protein
MITREADYAIRVVVCLTQSERDGVSVSTMDISEQMKIPYRFLRRIVRRMVLAGLLNTRRGKSGGVKLGRAPRKISVWDVVNTFDPQGAKLNKCLAAERICDRVSTCLVHKELNELQGLVEARLGSLTFDQVS